MKRQLWAGIGSCVIFGLLMWLSDAARGELLAAGERCLTVLVPSLYLYSLMAAFCIRSGGLAALSRIFGKNGMLLAVLLFSQIAGFPVGAQLLHEMERAGSLTRPQVRRAMCVCIGCGPGFLLGTVCRGMPLGLSLWMLFSVSLPNLVLGAVMLRNCRANAELPPFPGLSIALTTSADSAAGAMLKICAMVMAFAGVTGILEGLGAFAALPVRTAAGVRTVLEVSCVADYMRMGGTLPWAAAFLAFGGICVHLQVAAIAGAPDWLRFWGCRVISAACAYGICLLGVKFLFHGAVAVNLTQPRTVLTNGSILPGACLLLMSVLLLRRHFAKTP